MGRGEAGCPQHLFPKNHSCQPRLTAGIWTVLLCVHCPHSGFIRCLCIAQGAHHCNNIEFGICFPFISSKVFFFLTAELMCNMPSLQSFPLKLEKLVPSTFTSCLPVRIPGGCESRAKVYLGLVMMRTCLRRLPWLVPARGQGWRVRAAFLDL